MYCGIQAFTYKISIIWVFYIFYLIPYSEYYISSIYLAGKYFVVSRYRQNSWELSNFTGISLQLPKLMLTAAA